MLMSSPIHDEETETQRGIQLTKAMQVFWGVLDAHLPSVAVP